MPDEFAKNAPKATQDFNAVAKEQVKKEVPFASKEGISTKAEVDKRTEMETRLREKLQMEYKQPPPPPPIALAQKAAEEKFNTNKVALEENNKVKEQIRQRLEQKKKEEMSQEFNRVATPAKEFER